MVWVTGEKKSILLNNYNISDFDYYVLSQDGDCNNEWLAIRDKIQYEYDKYSSQTKNEIFLLSMFTRGFISKFNYRYSIIFERWDNDSQEWCENDTIEMNPEFNSIEEMLFDGTYDKSHNEKLLQYHKAGKPQKLALRWKAYKSEYSAYLWFDEVETRIAFKQFCNNYPNANMDFTIRIDTNIPFFQIILGCNGFDDALLLSESTFQLIVFKNGFEFYRSNNYNQPQGAWVW